jgi:hypothetical protein
MLFEKIGFLSRVSKKSKAQVGKTLVYNDERGAKECLSGRCQNEFRTPNLQVQKIRC